MINYLKGLLKNLNNPAVSLLALVDNRCDISRKAKINRFVKMVNSTIGRYSYIGGGSLIINTDIGAFCSIASDVCTGLAGHTMTMVSTSPIFTEKYNGTGHTWSDRDIFTGKRKRIRIGNDVWIGHGAKILNEVTIGDGAVIAAGAIVTKDVEPYAIVGGVPAKAIRYRFSKEMRENLLASEWWNLKDELLIQNIKSFQSELDEEKLNELISKLLPPRFCPTCKLLLLNTLRPVCGERRVA